MLSSRTRAFSTRRRELRESARMVKCLEAVEVSGSAQSAGYTPVLRVWERRCAQLSEGSVSELRPGRGRRARVGRSGIGLGLVGEGVPKEYRVCAIGRYSLGIDLT